LVVKFFSSQGWSSKGLGLKFFPARDLTVRAEAGKLQQVLLTLVANAIKFNPEREVG